MESILRLSSYRLTVNKRCTFAQYITFADSGREIRGDGAVGDGRELWYGAAV